MRGTSAAIVLVLATALSSPAVGAALFPAPPSASLSGRIAEALSAQALGATGPPASLRGLVEAFDDRFGVTRDPAAYVVLDTLDPAFAGPLAGLLGALLAAAQARDAAYAGIADATILAHLGVDPRPGDAGLFSGADAALMRSAAVTVAEAATEALPALQAYGARLLPIEGPHAVPPLVNLPPVLVADPLGVATLYTKDAVLAVDVGGNDTYGMNAGGSIIGIGPSADPASCQFNLLGLAAVGCEFEDAAVSITASLALDVAGDDHYGIRKPPRGLDDLCTNEPIIRRIVMQGAGSGGIGILVDAAGSDVYDAKTLAQGHGHIAGVGVLADLSGNDVYMAIRSAQGSGLLGGEGVFLDLGGDDQHLFDAPAGGIFNVDAGRCDASARLGLGEGVLAATGQFLDEGGNDVYRIESQAFGSGSLGHGVFVDHLGMDDYGGFPGRGDDQTATDFFGVFVDRSA